MRTLQIKIIHQMEMEKEQEIKGVDFVAYFDIFEILVKSEFEFHTTSS